MKIEILGTGCSKCQKLMANVEEYVKLNNINCEIEKVTDITKITEMGAMITPALAVDGDILSSGKVLSTTDIAKLLNKEMQECNCIDRHEDTPCKCSSSNSSSCCCCNQNNSKIKLIIIALIILILGFIAMLLIG